MSKPFSHSSLGRDLPPHPRRDPSRMGPGSANPSAGFGRAGQGSSRVSLMDLGSASKTGPQRSHNMPPGSSSQNIPSIFRLGGRGPAALSSQPSRDADHASNILASFGLSSIDLDELSRFPEDKITAENLPDIIQHLKRKRSEHMEMLSNRERLSRDSLRPSSDNWDDLRPLRRASFDDHPPGLNPVVDYGHGGNSRELSYRDRLDIDDSLRDRERFRDDRFSSDPSFRKSESDYNRLGYGSVQERSMPRGIPSARKIDDFHGLAPKAFPHLCTLCDLPVNNFQSWDEHVTGRLHKRQCLLLLDLYPEWNPRGMGRDPFMLPQSTNQAPGILGPPPPPLSLGGPNPRHGDFRGPQGPEEMSGPRQLPRQGVGRVVHVVDFERGRNLKLQLIKLVEPFGSVANTLILNNLNEAFIEMASPSQAVAVVEYYKLNPPLVYGKIVRVFLSQKYKRIKKEEDKDGKTHQKTDFRSDSKSEPKRDYKESKEEPGSVLRICNLPQSGYSDSAVVKLAETYGKVKTYILMRLKNQAFIEMEKAEDAQAMINRCGKSPLFFQGKSLIVGLSQKYKKLVLRIPNNIEELEKKSSRKRAHSPEGKNGKEKQKKTEQTEGSDTAELVTTEETDLTSEEIDQKELVSSSCEPELAEEDEEDDEEAAALLETSVSGDEAEVPDITDLDQDDTSQNTGVNLSSAPTAGDKKKAHAHHGNMQDFVTLDEVGDEEDVASHKKKFKDTALSADGTAKKGLNSVMASVEEAEQENETGQGEETDADKSETSLTEQTADFEVGPYQVNNPIGVDFVIPKTGFYCKLCSLFYTSEDVAKVTHCSTLAHYKKFKAYYSKPGKNTEKKD